MPLVIRDPVGVLCSQPVTAAVRDVENCILPACGLQQNRLRNVPTMKKRQALKILSQVLRQDQPIVLPDGRRASKRAIRRTRELNPDLLADRDPPDLKRMANLARRFDSAKRRREQIFNRNFRRRARGTAVGAGSSRQAPTIRVATNSQRRPP